MGNPVERRHGESAVRRADDGGTWRFRSNLTKVAVGMGLLGLGMVVSGAVSGFWPDYGAAACWLALGGFAWRLNRHLADGTGLPTVRRGALALYGLGLFLLGTAFIVLGRLVLG